MFTIVARRGHGLIRQIIQKVFEFCNIIIMLAFEWDIISVAGFAHAMHMIIHARVNINYLRIFIKSFCWTRILACV